MKELQIVNLADHPQYADEFSRLTWEWWGKKEGRPIEEIQYRTKHSLGKNDIPQVIIALLEKELAGFVSLWDNDFSNRQDLRPWLASLYVKEEHRGKGIGTALQKRAIELVKQFGYKKLYLRTDEENYYERTGWKLKELAPLKGKTTRVYEYEVPK